MILEKENIVPVHKKESKIFIKNYRPTSLLPFFRKFFELLIFNDLFKHFIKNELFTKCQSGFLPGDSLISQLISILYEISVDVRGIFLDVSKAFDKV